jgi:hypothetical protein
MKYFKLDLLTLLISLFILSSCENPDSIGLDIDPADQISGTLIDTSTVSAQTVLEDSVLTTDLSQQPLGYMQSLVFGKTEANLALGLSLPADSGAVRFGSNPLLDSAVLVLRYGDEFYGDSLSSAFSINLHQLNEQISSSASYYNNKSWIFNPTVLASKTVNRFGLRDTIRVTEIRKGKADTIIRGLPQLRVRVNNSFISENFLNAAADNFSTNTKFASFIKGLYLTINKSQSTGSGGIVFFVPDSSRLELYYRRQTGSTIDTNVLRFPISASASNTKNDYTGTDVKNHLDNPTQKFERVYVQSLGGVRTKIDFPYIQQLKNLGNIAINKAELEITVDQGVNNNPFAPAPRLMLYRTDIAGQRQEVPDNDIGQVNGFGDARSVHIFNFGGFYDTTKKTYTFNIASYVQDLLSGNLKQNEIDTYLAPIKNNLVRTGSRGGSPDPRVADIFPSGTTAGQSVLGSGTSPTYKMKLKIIYSKLGQ